MTRRWAWPIAALSAAIGSLTAGCGEPGLPDPGIALGADSQGRLFLALDSCADIGRIEVGPGDDMWGEATLSVTPESATRSVTIELKDPRGVSFDRGSRESLGELAPPFFVRVEERDGVVDAVISFTEAPSPGAVTLVKEYGDSSPVEVASGDWVRGTGGRC